MTAGGVKQLRLCPFCGQMGEPELKISGAACWVRCMVCGSEGPVESIYNYMPYCSSAIPDNVDINDLLEEAEKSASEAAAHKWNIRAWEGNLFPDELEQMEAKYEQEADV